MAHDDAQIAGAERGGGFDVVEPPDGQDMRTDGPRVEHPSAERQHAHERERIGADHGHDGDGPSHGEDVRDEQGLAYTTFSNITSSAGLDPGRFIAYIGTAPENLTRAIAGLRGEIARIVREPVTDEELETAKSYLTGSFVLRFQKNSQIAEFLLEAEVYGLGFDYLEKYPDLIRAVTVEDVSRVARTHIDPENMTTVVVGPADALK